MKINTSRYAVALRPGVQFALTAQERQRIYRFRYCEYVEKQKKSFQTADHVKRILQDELDDWGDMLFIEKEGEIIATVRVNFQEDGPIADKTPKELQLERFFAFPEANISYCSRLAVAEAWRTPEILVSLLHSIYLFGRSRQTQFNVIYCADQLLPFFTRLGYRQYAPRFEDVEVGLRNPMALVMEDVDYLRGVKSTFLACLNGAPCSQESARWFAREFEVDQVCRSVD